MSTSQEETQRIIDRELARGGIESERPAEPQGPTYKVFEDAKIAISKEEGKLWHSRRDQALNKLRNRHYLVAWKEAIEYYQNNQVRYRQDSDGNWSRSKNLSASMNDMFSETENIVFANVSAMVPAIYAKNPDIAVSGDADEDEYPVPPDTIRKLVTRLFQKRAYPGLNLKAHARRNVVHTTLTNLSYIEVGYTFRKESSDQAREELAKLSDELRKADSQEEIRRIEGALRALEVTTDFLRPAGPWCRFLRSDQVLWDAESVHEDRSDAQYCMIWEYISTQLLQAQYGKPDKEDPASTRLIYEPTHVLLNSEGGESGHQKSAAAPDELYQFALLSDEERESHEYEYTHYGYKDELSWRRAQRTKCWWVWDKTRMRLMLFHDKDWTWPLWVWEDPYNLEGFFPVYPLVFYTDPVEDVGKSEVSYYLDQQDGINRINSELNHMRHMAMRNMFFNKESVDRDDVSKLIKGDQNFATGVSVPEGQSLRDMVISVLPTSAEALQLFDKNPQLQAVDRISSVTEVQRGAEFKTNTTNQAIAEYTSNAQTRLDEKIDAVEDLFGRVGWAIAQLCLQFMDQEAVARLIGPTRAGDWQNLSPEDIAIYYSLNVEGGSTTKPTSSAQKAMALEIGQVLGQFVNAAPQATVGVMLRVFERAFPEVIIEDEDWQSLHAAIGSEGIAGNEVQAGADAGDPIAQIEQLVDQLPPEAKQALGMAMARGVPVREALERIVGATQQPAQAQG